MNKFDKLVTGLMASIKLRKELPRDILLRPLKDLTENQQKGASEIRAIENKYIDTLFIQCGRNLSKHYIEENLDRSINTILNESKGFEEIK